jgi:hypothetical protein
MSLVPATNFATKNDIIQKFKASEGRFPTGAEAMSWYYANWFPMDKTFDTYYGQRPEYITYRLQPAFSFSTSLLRASEGDTVTFDVTILTSDSPSLSYTISPASSIVGSTSGTLTFPRVAGQQPNSRTDKITFQIRNDADLEMNEIVTVTLSNPSNGALLTSILTVIVNPSDIVIPAQTPVLSLRDPIFVFEDGTLLTDENYDRNVREDNIFLSYILERSFIEDDYFKEDFPVLSSVDWNTVDLAGEDGDPRATAIAGYDYFPASGSIFFFRNDRTIELRVKVSSELIDSRDNYFAKTVVVEIKNPVGADLDPEKSWCSSPSSYYDKENSPVNTSGVYSHKYVEDATMWRVTTGDKGKNPKTEIWENGSLIASFPRGASMAEATIGTKRYFRSIGKKETSSSTTINLDFALSKRDVLTEVASTTYLTKYQRSGIKFFVMEEKQLTPEVIITYFVWDDIAIKVFGTAESVTFEGIVYTKAEFNIIESDSIYKRSLWKIKRNLIKSPVDKFIPMETARLPENVGGFIQTNLGNAINPDDKFCAVPFASGSWWFWMGFPYKTNIILGDVGQEGPRIKAISPADNTLGYTVVHDNRGVILMLGSNHGGVYSVYSHRVNGDDLVEPTPLSDFNVTAALISESDTGVSQTDRITSDTTPTITGKGMAGSTIVVTNATGTAIGTTTCTEDNEYTVTTSTLSTGLQNLSIKNSDASGYTKTVSLGVTVDTATTGTCTIRVYNAGAGVVKAVIAGWVEERSTINSIKIYDVADGFVECPTSNIVWGDFGNWSYAIEPDVSNLLLNDTILILKVSHTDVAGNSTSYEQYSNPAKKVTFDADWMQITYTFTDGNDMDTATRIINPAIGGGYEGYGGDGQSYIDFGGDNRGVGTESCLVYTKSLSNAYPNQAIVIDCQACWYSAIGYNPVKLEVVLWQGGNPSKSGFSWVNNSATDSLAFNSIGKVITGFRAYNNVGTAVYSPATVTGYLVNKP